MVKKSLKKQVSVGITVFVLSVIIISYYVFTNTVRKSILNNVGTLRYSEAKLVANNISDFINRASITIHDLSKQLVKIDANPSALQSYLNNFIPLLNLYDNGIFVFNEKGDLLAEIPFLDNKRVGMNFSHREYFQNTIATKKFYLSKPYLSSKTNKYSIMFTIPVFEGEKIKYVIGGSINIQSDYNPIGALQNHKIGEKGYYYIYTKDRDFIFHPENSRIGKRDVPLGVNKLFDAAIEGFEGFGETTNSRGKHFFATFVHINGSNWILGGNYPIEEALMPYENLKREIILLSLVIFVVTVFGSLLLFVYFNRPLINLANKIEEIDIIDNKIKRLNIDSEYYYKEIEPIVVKINLMLDKLNIFQDRMVDMAKYEALNIIAGGLFHDISNHIMSANSRIYLLKKRCIANNNKEEQNILNELEDIMQRITGLTKKILALSHTQSKDKKLINVKDLIENVVNLSKLEDKIVEIKLESDSDLWMIYGDEMALFQVFQNILINAMQAQTDCSKPIEISIRNFDNRDQKIIDIPFNSFVKVTIKDYGEGIDRENLSKIFDPYFTTKNGGYGIGLAVAKKIVLDHGGYIFVSSEKGKGTEFTIYLQYYAEMMIEDIKKDKGN